MRSPAGRSRWKPEAASPICRSGWSTLIWRSPGTRRHPANSATRCLRPSPDISPYEVHRSAESAKVVVQQRLSSDSRSAPMPTECSADLFEFAPVEGREVVAGFDGGAISSDAGALLLGQ